MLALTLLLAALAVARLTRLVVEDEATAGLRKRVGARGERWAYFVTCPWCVSPWLATPVAAVAVLWPGNRLVLGALLVPAASLVAGWQSTLEARADR